MYIIEFIYKVLEAVSWPAVVLTVCIYLIKKLPEYFGVLNYKHLCLLTHIKDQLYFYTELYRNNMNNGVISKNGVENIYRGIINNYTQYDLNVFHKQYLALYPELKSLKLLPLKKKARTYDEQKVFVNNYLNNLNQIVVQMLSIETFRDREQLLQFSQQIPKWISALK